jgi:hypothetical protein
VKLTAYNELPIPQAASVFLIEPIIATLRHEKVVLVETNGSTSTISGTKGKVVFSSDALPKDPDLVLVHNHPHCVTFSDEDMLSMLRAGIREIRVVCHLGNNMWIHRLRSRKSFRPSRALELAFITEVMGGPHWKWASSKDASAKVQAHNMKAVQKSVFGRMLCYGVFCAPLDDFAFIAKTCGGKELIG